VEVRILSSAPLIFLPFPEADDTLDAQSQMALVVEGGDQRRARPRPFGDVAVVGIESEFEAQCIPVWRELGLAQ
jgi:hypothetical protein